MSSVFENIRNAETIEEKHLLAEQALQDNNFSHRAGALAQVKLNMILNQKSLCVKSPKVFPLSKNDILRIVR